MKRKQVRKAKPVRRKRASAVALAIRGLRQEIDELRDSMLARPTQIASLLARASDELGRMRLEVGGMRTEVRGLVTPLHKLYQEMAESLARSLDPATSLPPSTPPAPTR